MSRRWDQEDGEQGAVHTARPQPQGWWGQVSLLLAQGPRGSLGLRFRQPQHRALGG